MTTDTTMELTLSTKSLRATLARMKKLGGKSPGDVILELKPVPFGLIPTGSPTHSLNDDPLNK